MKATPLLISWHNDQSPIYSCHFEPHGRGRLATAGGDSNVRLWKVESNGDSRSVSYLSTLVKHTQTVNVVRWCPRGEILGSAGDDGNVLLWVPSEHPERNTFGEDGLDNKETWRVKHMFRSMGSEIYDMAWSPDGMFFITGSMDNIARIYNAHTGQAVRQIAEHNHYVQGVAWDPLNEFVATQSSDRSVHIYTLKSKDGQFSLANHSKVTRMDLPSRRISSNSPAPPDLSHRANLHENRLGSPIPSAPGTPNSLALPMNPPLTARSRRSSIDSLPSMRRSASPAPSMPLPAVMPGGSPSIGGLGAPITRNTNIYANETFISFFRRLTFSSDGALLFTPAGQYKMHIPPTSEFGRPSEDTVNTVYIYTRAGLNKPPIAYLPGHKKPSIAVKCSPVYYTLRPAPVPTKTITVDTSSAEDEISALPEPALPTKAGTPQPTTMEPPPLTSAPSPSPSMLAMSPRTSEPDTTPTSVPPATGPAPAFALPYRMVYAVATLDAVHIYDTQQTLPLCVVSNLHYAIFTDLTWASDGNTLIISSSDGFCSTLAFSPNELGTVYTGPVPTATRPTPTPSHSAHPSLSAVNTSAPASSAQSTPAPTPTSASGPKSSTTATTSAPSAGTPSAFPAPPSPMSSIHSAAANAEYARPRSPARSMSVSSIASSFAPVPTSASGSSQPPAPAVTVPGTATPSFSSIPAVTAGPSGPQPVWTPPLTPGSNSVSHAVPGTVSTHSARSSVSIAGSGAGFVGRALSGGVGGMEVAVESESEREVDGQKEGKRGAEARDEEEPRQAKKRRIAPTPVEENDGS